MLDLLYEPPRCGYPLIRDGFVKKAEGPPKPMRRVGRRVEQGGSYFDEYRCRFCSHRARVLMRDRSKPFILARGQEIAPGILDNGCPSKGGCGSESTRSSVRVEIGEQAYLVSVCASCHSVSYAVNPSGDVGIEVLLELGRRS
jgi:hypothetical protein